MQQPDYNDKRPPLREGGRRRFSYRVIEAASHRAGHQRHIEDLRGSLVRIPHEMSFYVAVRGLAAISLALAALALQSCDGTDPIASAPDSSLGQRPPPWDVKTECPESISILDRPNCRLLSRSQRLRPCPAATVGHDVRAAGISCTQAYGLLSPLGGSAGFGVFNRARQQLTRPAVATYSPPFQIRGTGWTCWADFVPDRSYGEQFVCWRESAVMTFKFS